MTGAITDEAPATLEPRPPSSGTTLLLAGTAAALCGASALVHPLAPLAGAAALLVLAAAWFTPLVAALLVTVATPVLSGLARGLALPLLKVSEVLLLLAVAALVARRPPRGTRMHSVEWGFLVFALTGAVFGALHVANGNSPAPTFVRIGLQPFLLFLTWWAAARATQSEGHLRVVLRWVLLASLVPAILAVLQALDAPLVREALITLTQGPLLPAPGSAGVVRVTGPFPIWHSLGGYLVPVLLLAVALLLRGDTTVLSRPALLVVLATGTAAVVLSLTITVILWLVAGVLVVALFERRLGRALVLIVGAVLVSSLLFPSAIENRIDAQYGAADGAEASSAQVPQTVGYRVQVWQRDYLPLIKQAVPAGVGNDLPESVLFTATENQYISYVLRGGVWLLLAATTAVVALAFRVRRVLQSSVGPTRAVAESVAATLVFLPLALMVWPYLINAGLPQSLLALAGAGLGSRAADRMVHDVSD